MPTKMRIRVVDDVDDSEGVFVWGETLTDDGNVTSSFFKATSNAMDSLNCVDEISENVTLADVSDDVVMGCVIFRSLSGDVSRQLKLHGRRIEPVRLSARLI